MLGFCPIILDKDGPNSAQRRQLLMHNVKKQKSANSLIKSSLTDFCVTPEGLEPSTH